MNFQFFILVVQTNILKQYKKLTRYFLFGWLRWNLKNKKIKKNFQPWSFEAITLCNNFGSRSNELKFTSCLHSTELQKVWNYYIQQLNLLHPTIEPIPEFHGKKSKKQTNLHLPTQSVNTVHRALGWANSD